MYSRTSPPTVALLSQIHCVLGSYKLRDNKQRVGIAIMRACAQAVIKGFEGSPHAALTAVNRYQGPQGRRGPPRGA